MFSFFRAKCPVDAETAGWVHERMAFLTREFGDDAWRGARVILPTDAFFPDRYDGSAHALERMLGRVCGYMGVDPDRVALRLYSEESAVASGLFRSESEGGTAGLYAAGEREVIAIETSRVSDPVAVVATMAHELAHARLLGEHRITGEEEDHELLTDLLTIFLGLGIFTANSRVRYTQWTREGWYGWGMNKLGYLSERASCYALGGWAHGRGETRPEWMKHLTPGPRAIVRETLRWAEKQERCRK